MDIERLLMDEILFVLLVAMRQSRRSLRFFIGQQQLFATSTTKRRAPSRFFPAWHRRTTHKISD